MFSDAEDILRRSPDYRRIGLITDGAARSQERKIKALKLDSFVHTILVTDLFGRQAWKPSPTAFQYFSQVTQAKPANLIYVGDNANKDFVAPNALGWTTVHICRPDGIYDNYAEVPQHYKAQHTIRSLDEMVWA